MCQRSVDIDVFPCDSRIVVFDAAKVSIVVVEIFYIRCPAAVIIDRCNSALPVIFVAYKKLIDMQRHYYFSFIGAFFNTINIFRKIEP